MRCKVKYLLYLLLMIILMFYARSSSAEETITFQSGTEQVALVELFTSQGCSSSPPAEIWLNRFVDHPDLWKTIVPIAYHVDYWDYLGWKDPYSANIYSNRQRTYRDKGHVNSVYTPGFVVNGREWRGWFRGLPMPTSNNKTGILSASYESDNLKVDYSKHENSLVLNVAVLGFGIITNVKAGENHNRSLDQEFVVISHKKYTSDDGSWDVTLPDISRADTRRLGLALWVHTKDNLTPLQATGGWL